MVPQNNMRGLLLTTIGVAAGLAGALGLNRPIASLLFGVQPTDTSTLAAVILTISLVAVVACWLPAWRLTPHALTTIISSESEGRKYMALKRMDNVLIVVDDLEAAKAFFLELGLKLEGESTVEGLWLGA